MIAPRLSFQDASRPTRSGFEDVRLFTQLVGFLSLRKALEPAAEGGGGTPGGGPPERPFMASRHQATGATYQFQTGCHVPTHRALELPQCKGEVQGGVRMQP